jgi:hypothetical protein
MNGQWKYNVSWCIQEIDNKNEKAYNARAIFNMGLLYIIYTRGDLH